uniref:BESS domain-containing protein n=1 Tax=Timema douglasi TaxID=61478 RepID=A0A7R8ZAM9_TIMDO|nr:unnamed protein product [Timema douglasi]
MSDEDAAKQLKETDVCFQPTQSTLSMTTPTKKKKRQCADTYNQTLLNVEKDKMQYLRDMSAEKIKTEIEDEDLLFFKSLLSHVRKIPASRKLYFRCQVQELVEQFAYNQESSSSIPPTFHSCSSSPSTYPTDSFPNANNSPFPVQTDLKTSSSVRVREPRDRTLLFSAVTAKERDVTVRNGSDEARCEQPHPSLGVG